MATTAWKRLFLPCKERERERDSESESESLSTFGISTTLSSNTIYNVERGRGRGRETIRQAHEARQSSRCSEGVGEWTGREPLQMSLPLQTQHTRQMVIGG